MLGLWLGVQSAHKPSGFSLRPLGQSGPLRSERGCQAPRARHSPLLIPIPRFPPLPYPPSVFPGPLGSCREQVCSCQPSSIFLIKTNELRLPAAGPCHVASSRAAHLWALRGHRNPPPSLSQEQAKVPGAKASKSLLSPWQFLATLQAPSGTARWWLGEGGKLPGRPGHGAAGSGQPSMRHPDHGRGEGSRCGLSLLGPISFYLS